MIYPWHNMSKKGKKMSKETQSNASKRAQYNCRKCNVTSWHDETAILHCIVCTTKLERVDSMDDRKVPRRERVTVVEMIADTSWMDEKSAEGYENAPPSENLHYRDSKGVAWVIIALTSAHAQSIYDHGYKDGLLIGKTAPAYQAGYEHGVRDRQACYKKIEDEGKHGDTLIIEDVKPEIAVGTVNDKNQVWSGKNWQRPWHSAEVPLEAYRAFLYGKIMDCVQSDNIENLRHAKWYLDKLIECGDKV